MSDSEYKLVNLPDGFPAHSVNTTLGNCMHCDEPATVHTLADREQVVCHAGVMCERFRRQFTATTDKPLRTPACDETGDITDFRYAPAVNGSLEPGQPIDVNGGLSSSAGDGK